MRISFWFKWISILSSASIAALALFLAVAYLYLSPELPDTALLKDVKLQVPLRVFARDGSLLAEFGEKRRSPIPVEAAPKWLVQAFLAAEDDRFYEHPGVDYQGLIRAVLHLIRTGEKGQGGSTITMQVARNFFLSREKTYLRKLNEIFLSLKIENKLSKAEILGLYLNKIYLGNRAYGIQAAARVYYGKNVHELNLAQMAMVAGLPKAPSRYNPIANPQRALIRRDYVLRRMLELEYISEQDYQEALQTPISANLHAVSTAFKAPYVAEMVRAAMVKKYGNQAYTRGYRVYTTLSPQNQQAANKALRTTLLDYDHRHGYRGAEQHLQLDAVDINELTSMLDSQLRGVPVIGGMRVGVVTDVMEKSIRVYLGQDHVIKIEWDGLKWAKAYINDNRQGPEPEAATEIVQKGDMIRLLKQDEVWHLSQVPTVSGALVSLDPHDGAIVALVGGFDFLLSKFNRATQAERQPGSDFKPFIYSAALEKGYTAATLINDAPVVFEDSALEGTWRPENYSGRFYGPTRLRVALMKSRNLISIRLLRAIGIGYAVNYVSRFGFDKASLPRDLSLALGSTSTNLTPLKLATGYAVFANGGFLVTPYVIERIETEDGELVEQAQPAVACRACELEQNQVSAATAESDLSVTNEVVAEGQGKLPENRAKRVITAQNQYIMYSILQDVIRQGTGRKALTLGRRDLAGKTGTTNDQRDAWFSGFNGALVTTVWVGFDKGRPLGASETGGRAALPMWITYMRDALKGVPDQELPQPAGLVTVRIDRKTGKLASKNNSNTIFEIFRPENVPQEEAGAEPIVDPGGNVNTETRPEEIF